MLLIRNIVSSDVIKNIFDLHILSQGGLIYETLNRKTTLNRKESGGAC